MSGFLLLIFSKLHAQIPENINPGPDDKGSLWESPVTIAIVIALIIIVILGYKYTKNKTHSGEDEENSSSEN